MRIHITGIAGVLGSGLAEAFVNAGYDVQGNDVQRIEEAWRLSEVRDRVRYMWKSTTDLTQEDLEGVDLIIDAGLAVADRPLGTSSPEYTVINNLLPPLRLLELVRRMSRKPIVIYPSSFNALYGHGNTEYTEDLLPNPTTIYGFTKASAELLYLTYHRSFGVPVIITRVGSAFGPKGRLDELPHKLIYYGLLGRRFYLRSPYASRLWTYKKDAVNFYMKLIPQANDFIGMVLHLAGNRGDEVVTNVELARRVKKYVPTLEWVEGEYEPGELINGKPLTFRIGISRTRKLLGWEPQYTLDEGLRETVEWFKRYLSTASLTKP